MTMTILAPASPPPVLDLEARLALADAVMSVRLDEAAAQFAIRTSHIAIDPVPETAVTVPLTPTLAPAPQPSPYSTPMADLLHRACGYISTRGLLRGGLRDENDVEGARCPIGAIRYEAGGNRWLADDACTLLLDVIQAEFADADTIPSWVDRQTSAATVLACMSRAAELAHTRKL